MVGLCSDSGGPVSAAWAELWEKRSPWQPVAVAAGRHTSRSGRGASTPPAAE